MIIPKSDNTVRNIRHNDAIFKILLHLKKFFSST